MQSNPTCDFLRVILSLICKEATITITETQDAIIAQVDSGNHGRVVGKRGIVIWALATLAFHAGIKHTGRPTKLELIDPTGTASFTPKLPFKANRNWDKRKLGQLLDSILGNTLQSKGAWVLQETGEAEAIAMIQLGDHKHDPDEPDLVEAIEIIVHAAGMAMGADVEVEIS